MLIIYTHSLTPRVKYIFKQIFSEILGIEISFCLDKKEFQKTSLPKLSYSHSPIDNELFFQCHELLFEKGIIERNINVFNYNNLSCFFSVNNSVFPFDPFAASFFMISRYEEYLPHIKDIHGRFEAKESLAFKNNFLEKPIVDIWTNLIKKELEKKYPKLFFPKKKFQFISSIDVDSAYLYKEKGIIRTIFGSISDLILFNYHNLSKRFKVLFGFESDPFDTFNKILATSKKYNIHTIFFFLLGDYNKYDKSISFSSKIFQSLIKSVNDHVLVGIHPSVRSLSKKKLLKIEIERLQKIIHKNILNSRQHYIKLDMPNMYKNLLNSSIKNDYSMGFASMPGFRSGTCNSYFFYDLDLELETDLKIHPFIVMDVTLKNYLNLDPKDAISKIYNLINEVKYVNGTFTSVWHNQSLFFENDWQDWHSVYENMIKYVSDLKDEQF